MVEKEWINLPWEGNGLIQRSLVQKGPFLSS
jgi:hypothetical protein